MANKQRTNRKSTMDKTEGIFEYLSTNVINNYLKNYYNVYLNKTARHWPDSLKRVRYFSRKQ